MRKLAALLLLPLLACSAEQESVSLKRTPPALAEPEPEPEPEPQPEESEEPEEPELPPARTEYMGREIAQTMHWSGGPWLLRDSREAQENTAAMLAALGIEEGWTVCDLGCGNGYHSLRLAKLAGPAGKVLAVDIQLELLTQLVKRAGEAEIENVEPVHGGVADPKIGAGTCDLVLLADVYHELSHPEQVLARVRAALRPKGRLALLEFRAEDPDVPIKEEHKMAKAQIVKELTANGFRLVEEFDDLPWQHLVFFERDDSKR